MVKDEAQFFKPQSAKDRQGATDQGSTRVQPDLVERYEEEGIFGLLRQGQVDAFRGVVWDLAKCIQQIYYNQLLKPRKIDPGELRNVFEGGVQ